MKRIIIIATMIIAAIFLSACGADQESDSGMEALEDQEIQEDQEYAEDDYLGDYTILYLQSGPLALVYDNKDAESGIGAIDSTGQLVVPCLYQNMIYIGHDRYFVSKGEDNINCTYGVVDLQGNEIVPCEYTAIGEETTSETDPMPYGERVAYFLDGYEEPEGVILPFIKKKGGSVEYISIVDGEPIADPDDEQIMRFKSDEDDLGSRDETAIPENIQEKYSDVFGIPFGSTECFDYKGVQCHYYCVGDEDGYLILNQEGEVIGDGTKWADVGFECGNGLICVKKEEGEPWCLIDSNGNEVTDSIFDVIIDNA